MAARDPDTEPSADGPGIGNGAAGAPASETTAIAATATAVPAASDMQGDGFDGWLQTELARLYGGALDEPVPGDIIRLLEDAARGR